MGAFGRGSIQPLSCTAGLRDAVSALASVSQPSGLSPHSASPELLIIFKTKLFLLLSHVPETELGEEQYELFSHLNTTSPTCQ